MLVVSSVKEIPLNVNTNRKTHFIKSLNEVGISKYDYVPIYSHNIFLYN